MELPRNYLLYCFFILIFAFTLSPLHAQINNVSFPSNRLPESNFIYYSEFLTYINPAGARLQHPFTVNAKVGSYTGIRKNISEYYLDAFWKLKDTTRLSLGVQFYSNKQGNFIHFTEAKWITRYSILLNKEIHLIPAVGIGLMNFTFEGNNYSAGGSSRVPDLDLGISLQSRQWNVGISTLHLIDKKLQPISATFDKNTYVNILLSRISYFRNPNYSLKYYLVSSYNRKSKNLYHDITVELAYLNKLKAIGLLYHGNVLGMGFGLQELDTPAGQLGINFIYSVGFFTSNLLYTSRYELGISYKFKQKVTF